MLHNGWIIHLEVGIKVYNLYDDSILHKICSVYLLTKLKIRMMGTIGIIMGDKNMMGEIALIIWIYYLS